MVTGRKGFEYLLLSILLGSCSPKAYQSMMWKSGGVAPDGKNEEWGELLSHYDKKGKFFYELGNDSDNLYLAVSSRDAGTTQGIMRGGIEFKMDPSGDNKFPLQLTFPVQDQQRGPGIKGTENQGKGNANPLEKNMNPGEGMKMPDTPGLKGPGGKMMVKGFSEIEDSLLANGNPYGIEANMNMRDSVLFVELKIPFKTFYKEVLTPADTLHPFNFEILLSTVASSKSEDGMRPGGGSGFPPSGRGMGGPGGGPGGGGMFGGGGERPSGPPPAGNVQSGLNSGNKKIKTEFLMKLSLK